MRWTVLAGVCALMVAATPAVAECSRDALGNLDCGSMSDLTEQQRRDLNSMTGGSDRGSISSRPNPVGRLQLFKWRFISLESARRL